MATLPWLYAAVLAIAHYIQPRILDPARTRGVMHERIASFAAGFSVAFLFLWLLPESVDATPAVGSAVFLAMLAGFALLHLAEKFIYVHDHAKRRKLLRDLAIEHSIVFFIYYGLVGLAMVFLARRPSVSLTLFFIPILLHAFVSRAALGEVHGRVRENVLIGLLLASSPLLGVALGESSVIPLAAFDALYGLIVGSFFYIVIKDLLPERQHGLPLWFIIGAAILLALTFIFRPY